MTAASDMHCLPAQGKIKSERRARAGVALDANHARIFLDDAVGYGNPKPGAAALTLLRGCLGREKRAVKVLNMLHCDPRTGVAYAQDDHFTVHCSHAVRPIPTYRLVRIRLA